MTDLDMDNYRYAFLFDVIHGDSLLVARFNGLRYEIQGKIPAECFYIFKVPLEKLMITLHTYR